MHVTLFQKAGCHLCEDALASLQRLHARYPHTLEVVDITAQPELTRRYGERIPVLRIGTREYDPPLSAQAVEGALRQHSAS